MPLVFLPLFSIFTHPHLYRNNMSNIIYQNYTPPPLIIVLNHFLYNSEGWGNHNKSWINHDNRKMSNDHVNKRPYEIFIEILCCPLKKLRL